MTKDKEYIVDKKIDTKLTEAELKKLRQKSRPVGEVPLYNRQDVLVDRRDPLAKKDPAQKERRRNKGERRDLEPG